MNGIVRVQSLPNCVGSGGVRCRRVAMESDVCLSHACNPQVGDSSDPPCATSGADLHPLAARLASAVATALCRARHAIAQDLQLGTGSADSGAATGRHRCGGGVALSITTRCGSRIVVVGDFDADGATSTALVVRQLARLGFAHVGFIVPNRFEYGYGLTPEIVRLAAAQQPALIITVDNGISSHAGVLEAQRARHRNARHRSSLARGDDAGGCSDRESQCAGRGVSQQGAGGCRRGVLSHGGADARDAGARPACAQPPSVADLLDLVALGTVADLVPLDRNNRVLVQQGLRRIRAGRCVPGIRALLEASNRCACGDVVASDLGFQVGPRLNAAGRLDDMSVGIQCLLTDDVNDSAGCWRDGCHNSIMIGVNSSCRCSRRRMLAVADMRDEQACHSDCACSMRPGIRASWVWWPRASRIASIGR